MAEDFKRKKAMYSHEEKELLRELVLQRKDILETRKCDFATLTEKKRAWEEIREEFNSFGGPQPRTTDQLRKLWENIKFRRKAELAVEKQGVKRCAKDDVASEAIKKVKRAQLQLDAETTIQKLRIEEQKLKLEYIQRKNEQIKTEELHQDKKRRLEILILTKQLQQLEQSIHTS